MPASNVTFQAACGVIPTSARKPFVSHGLADSRSRLISVSAITAIDSMIEAECSVQLCCNRCLMRAGAGLSLLGRRSILGNRAKNISGTRIEAAVRRSKASLLTDDCISEFVKVMG